MASSFIIEYNVSLDTSLPSTNIRGLFDSDIRSKRPPYKTTELRLEATESLNITTESAEYTIDESLETQRPPYIFDFSGTT